MIITKEIGIDMGHRVPNHNSKCRNIHGHRYRIEVGVDDKVIQEKGTSSEGMVIDFTDLKKIMMKEIDERLDHGFMCYRGDIALAAKFTALKNEFDMKIIFVDFIPTAENIAKYLFDLLEVNLKAVGIQLHHVRIWETPSSSATYKKAFAHDFGK